MKPSKSWIDDCKDCIHNELKVVCDNCDYGELFEDDQSVMLNEDSEHFYPSDYYEMEDGEQDY